MFENSAMLAGFALKGKSEFWQQRLERFLPSPLIQEKGAYCVRIYNSNWDAKTLISGTTLGIYDGLELKSKAGLLLENIPDNLPVTTGLAAYWDPQKQTLALISSPASSRKIFYRQLPEGVVFSSDARLLMDDDDTVDAIGAAQLLIYGTISGFRSLLAGIKPVPMGFMAKLNLGENRITEELLPVLKYKWEPQDVSEDQIDATVDTIRDSLMGVLEQISQHKTAVLLSGGTDSGLLACLLKDMGVKDVQMFTCGFSKDDLDVQYAAKLAKKLGYSHTVIMFKEKEALKILDECPGVYSMPFGDFSTISSYFIVKQVSALVDKGTYLLDGTAGDALFGFGGLTRIRRMRRLWRIPHFAKRLASGCYSGFGLWQNEGFCSRAIGAVAAAIVPHPALIGIILTPWAGRLKVSTNQILTGGQELFDLSKRILRGQVLSDEDLLTSLDFVHTCGSLYSNKVADPARHFGCAAEFPFMWPEMAQLGFILPVSLKLYKGRVKYPLKHLLTRYAGADYVNRPKTGFTPPFKKWLAQPKFNEWFQQVISKMSLLRDVLEKVPVEEIVQATLGNPRYFQITVYSLVWTVAFTEKWFAARPDKA